MSVVGVSIDVIIAVAAAEDNDDDCNECSRMHACDLGTSRLISQPPLQVAPGAYLWPPFV